LKNLLKKGKNLKRRRFTIKFSASPVRVISTVFIIVNSIETFSDNTSLDNKEKTSSDIFSNNEKILPENLGSIHEKQELLDISNVKHVKDESKSNYEMKVSSKLIPKNSEINVIEEVKQEPDMIESLPLKKNFVYLSSEEIQQKVSEKKKEIEHELYDAIKNMN
jgi:hypothetical protein